MAKTVLKLNESDQFDFILIGIICHEKDYRLCHELNNQLEISLQRQDDYEVYNNKRMESQEFSLFSYINPDDDEYYLISNKGTRGLLIPEQRQIDYLLLVKQGMSEIDDVALSNSMKKIEMVLGVYKLDAIKLRSRENLVF